MTRVEEPTIVEVLRHHLWANRKLFEFCQSLTPGQLASSALGTYGSVYDTLRHIAVTEQWYLADLLGQGRSEPIQHSEQPTVAQLTRHIERTGAGLMERSRGLTMTELAQWTDRGPKESMLAVRLVIQAIDHAIEHRTQVRTILSQIGVTPPELDGWAYDADQPDKGQYQEGGSRSG